MPYAGVLFDVDGTLIGVRPEPEVFYRQVCAEEGLAWPEEPGRARAVALRYLSRHGLDYRCDERAMWRAANREVFSSLGAGERAGACAARFQELFYAGSEDYAFPDVLPALQGLQGRGYLLGALTGRLHSSEAVLVRLGLRPYFSFYLYAGELGVLKPDPRLYQEALARAGLPAAAVVLVGDHPDDAAGARSVGMVPLRIVRGGATAAGAEEQLTDLRQLLPWLEGQAARR